MKRLVYSEDLVDDAFEIDQVVSVILVDDIEDFNPRDIVNRDILSSKRYKLNYRDLTREQLLELSKSERDRISDVDVLRKFKPDELNPAQKVKVGQANRAKITDIPKSKIEAILSKLKQCHRFHVEGTDKNGTFVDELYNKGGVVQDKDARNVIKMLEVSDYKYGTRSTWDKNWSSLLLVFRFKGSYVFDPIEEGGQPVTEDHLDLYIKIDVERQTKKGYCVMSFHRWGEHNDE